VQEAADKAHPEDEHRDAGDGEAQAELEDLHPKFGLCQVFGHHPAPPLQSCALSTGRFVAQMRCNHFYGLPPDASSGTTLVRPRGASCASPCPGGGFRHLRGGENMSEGNMEEAPSVMTPESAPYIEMETSLGTIVIELYWQYAPLTCQVPCAHRASQTSADTRAPRAGARTSTLSARGAAAGRARGRRQEHGQRECGESEA
jgi:hypothetical protein